MRKSFFAALTALLFLGCSPRPGECNPVGKWQIALHPIEGDCLNTVIGQDAFSVTTSGLGGYALTDYTNIGVNSFWGEVDDYNCHLMNQVNGAVYFPRQTFSYTVRRDYNVDDDLVSGQLVGLYQRELFDSTGSPVEVNQCFETFDASGFIKRDHE